LITAPSAKTLAKYGLSEEEWWALLARQDGVCAVCRKVPNGRFCIDHDHVKGWKKMPPEKRKQHLRGLLCWFCNHTYVGRAITVAKSRNVTAYLEQHLERLAKAQGEQP
jgi:recombination endonuclease VII